MEGHTPSSELSNTAKQVDECAFSEEAIQLLKEFLTAQSEEEFKQVERRFTPKDQDTFVTVVGVPENYTPEWLIEAKLRLTKFLRTPAAPTPVRYKRVTSFNLQGFSACFCHK